MKRTRCEIYSRVVGYISPLFRWNKGKLAEFKKRKEYKWDEGDRGDIRGG